MPVTEIEIYEALKEQIGDKPARILLEYIETKTEKEFEKKKDVPATKQDIAELRADLEVKIERVRADLIRWMFIFWAGQIGALIAILALFFK